MHNASANPAASDRVRAALAADFGQLRRHYAAREFIAAEKVCRRMLSTAPGDPQVLLVLSEILSAQGRHEDALAILLPLAEQRPNAGDIQFFLGNALHAAGRFAEAAEHLRRATELQPLFAAGHYNLGITLEQVGDRTGAINSYTRAVSLQPNLAPARAKLGTALFKAGKWDDAVNHLRQAVALDPRSGRNHVFLGHALQQTGKFAEAVSLYERAVALEPSLADGWNALGAALRANGRFAEAVNAFEKALAIDPALGSAHQGLATLRQATANAAELDRLRETMTNPARSIEDRAAAAMAMAQMLDEAGRYGEAFAAAEEGNRLSRAWQIAADIRYHHEALQRQNKTAMRLFTAEFFAATRAWGNPSELPVFIAGYPRTGTTLIEQICASHSQVHGAGELRDVNQITAEIERRAPQPELWTADLFRGFADQHVARLAALAPGKRRVVDKAMDNIFALGLIAMMFPHARIIFTHRDGRDAALSTFLQYLNPQIAFATDLIDAGRHWREAERMSAYWSRCLPLAVHHVQYETLVADFEAEARRLIQFLGLAWEPACLEFFKTERAVFTASAWQVRQPLYDKSIGRWRNYAEHLAPLCAALGIDPSASTGTRPADLA